MKAKRAPTTVMTQERFNEPTNLWLGTTAFDDLKQVSDANPQFAKYLWGTAHLVHYVSEGKHLDGLVYLPDGFDRHKKYPMLVYFYERFSDSLNRLLHTGTGNVAVLSALREQRLRDPLSRYRVHDRPSGA